MRESTIEDYLVERVKSLGGEVRKVKWIGRHGAPDRLVMLRRESASDLDTLRRIAERGLKEAQSRNPAYIDLFQHMLDEISRIKPPLCVWVELKAPGEKAKPHQQREHERMRRMGQRVEVIDSIEGVNEVLL
jgi:hypothetical protein